MADDPRPDRDGRDADHRCPHGKPAGLPGGAAVWPCPDCHEDDCAGCTPYKRPGDRKRDKRGRCAKHREETP